MREDDPLAAAPAGDSAIIELRDARDAPPPNLARMPLECLARGGEVHLISWASVIIAGHPCTSSTYKVVHAAAAEEVFTIYTPQAGEGSF